MYETLAVKEELSVDGKPISSAYSQLVVGIERIQELTEALTQRLNGVLGPDYPTAEKGTNGKAQEVTSPFAEAIRSDAKRIFRVADSLENILRRIEL